MSSKAKQARREEGKAKSQAAQEEKEANLKVNKWDGSAVKNALDDTVKSILKEEYGCVEDFHLVDCRLVLCTVACSFSLFALLYDIVYPFPQSCTVLAVCAISYFVLMAVTSLYTIFVEGNKFMVGRQKDSAGVGGDNIWSLSSSLPRFSHVYSITVFFKEGQTHSTGNRVLEKSVTKWFDEDGQLAYDKFLIDIKQIFDEVSGARKKK